MSDSKNSEATPEMCNQEINAAPYAQRQLDPDERSSFEEHMRTCGSCKHAAAEFAEVLNELKRSTDVECDLTARICEAALNQRPARRPVILKISAALAAAAALLVAVLLGLGRQDGASGGQLYKHKQVVTKAQEWLASSQEADGSWHPQKWGGQPNFTVGLTALASVALIGSDADAMRGPYADNIRRATDFLLSQQTKSGRFGPTFGGALYNHGIATVALLERNGLEPIRDLKRPIDTAVAHMLGSQTKAGGWGYVGGNDPSANTPIAVWQMHALSLAASQGWTEAQDAADRGADWLRTLVDSQGRAGYTKAQDFPYGSDSLTAMAAFYLTARSGNDVPVGNESAMMSAVMTAAERPVRGLDYYRCYFLSYALRATHSTETPSATAINSKLVERQLQEGPNTGSWEPNDQWSVTGGRVYATALAALSLEAEARAPRVMAMLRAPR